MNQLDDRADLGGPVSQALEAELRDFVRRHGIVVWLDAYAHFVPFLDRLVAARAAGQLPYAVYAYRGSFLELMLALDGVAAGSDKSPVVVHLPGFNDTSITTTPLYELRTAGTLFRKALKTLVTEAAAKVVRPDEITTFTAQPDLDLAGADAWLAGRIRAGDDSEAGRLQRLPATRLVDELLAGRDAAAISSTPDDADVLWHHLEAQLGLPPAWRAQTLPATASWADVGFTAASWALCVEYVFDLTRPPLNELLGHAIGLPRPVIDTCRAIAAHLRQRPDGLYERTADATEALLADEVEAAQAADLGKIDTFRFEEDKVLADALRALSERAWERAATWSKPRVQAASEATSYWLRLDPMRTAAWQLVDAAAQLGGALTRAGASPGDGSGHAGFVAAYVERGAAVDQAHRHLEQRRVALLDPHLPEFETLRARLDEMRRHWRAWADDWAVAFQRVCRSHGFLPPADLQQRTLFDDIVRPLTQENGTTALFVVDALRFEMAEELMRQFDASARATIRLTPRLAELPTVTEVGMNVLAPVAKNGRLAPSFNADGDRFAGFQAGEFRVGTPDTRKRAMHDRVGGGTCPWMSLADVLGREAESLRRSLAQARLVVVHSQEIDTAGEADAGPRVFDVVLRNLRGAWRLLREAGVQRFVFTSDHGFLLVDESSSAAQTHGRRIDPKRRYVLSPVAADHDGEVRVPLADLGYDGATGHVMFPETTAVFDTGNRRGSFVHGGNSLQERVIPVLTVVHRSPVGASSECYLVHAEARDGVAGMHCLEVTVSVDTTALGSLVFDSRKEIELALRVPESSDTLVELCQVRGKARLAAATVVAPVGESFEIFFRLAGTNEQRVRVEVYHPSAELQVTRFSPDARFTVTALRQGSAPASRATGAANETWLASFEDDGVRQVFHHLATHGTLTEAEVAALVGGPRAARRFALQFEALAARAPFGIRIDAVGGVKRYVREGGE